jgi:hypothetical protein
MDASKLRQIPATSAPAISEWVGRWSQDGNPSLRFYLRDQKLKVVGDAYWPSRNPPLSERPFGPNVGHVDETVEVAANVARAMECNISFTLLGDLLVVADPDLMCGGANVTFTGVYRREKK